ncbi:MAG: hypothetical protein PW789_14625 [Edaphobacter sp.]|uniref:hypothetical protein n=1 Tax=Edaphobacter sp. TaxID=1934404 RepID=UPI00239F5DF2|nr:hypothetical protein [Edaphobacter sp.]MDE1177814.1 hypothetical protein [Edaphobacter sp.]
MSFAISFARLDSSDKTRSPSKPAAVIPLSQNTISSTTQADSALYQSLDDVFTHKTIVL